MNGEEFGLALAEGLSRELDMEVRFVHEGDDIILGPPKGAHTRISLETFRLMHEKGLSLEGVIEKLVRLQRANANSSKLTWDAVKDHVIPHVTASRHPSVLQLEAISPLLQTVAGIDTPESVNLLTPATLEQFGVSVEAVRAAAESNIDALLVERPGTEETIRGRRFLGFDCDLAADLAYAYAKKRPCAAVAFGSPDIAFVSEDVSAGALEDLAIVASVVGKERQIHAMPPAVHVFADGACRGLVAAVPLADLAGAAG